MGRPLKIQKIIATGNPGVDNGYPNFGSLTNPVVNSANTLNSNQFVGVVGGSNTVDTATFPTVKVSVNIALPNGSGQGQNDGYIIRQKGAHKYLVASLAAVEDEEMLVGATYIITSLDTTNWQQMGAPVGAQVGTIFTCTALCADPQNGAGNLVGQCVLTSDLTPSDAGTMSISYFVGDSTETAISKLTNKFLQNFAGGATGGNANTGDVWAAADTVDNVAYLANFFTDEGTMVKSGAESATWGANGSEQNAGGTLDLGIVENYNS